MNDRVSCLNVDTIRGSVQLKMAQLNGVDPSLTEDATISMISACASSPVHSFKPSKCLLVVFPIPASLAPEAAQQSMI